MSRIDAYKVLSLKNLSRKLYLIIYSMATKIKNIIDNKSFLLPSFCHFDTQAIVNQLYFSSTLDNTSNPSPARYLSQRHILSSSSSAFLIHVKVLSNEILNVFIMDKFGFRNWIWIFIELYIGF